LSKRHHGDYDDVTTARCERALVTLLGDIGPWSERVYLVGGLAPRYIVGSLPEGARTHVGTTDVDLVIGLAVGDESPEAYRTLENNLRRKLAQKISHLPVVMNRMRPNHQLDIPQLTSSYPLRHIYGSVIFAGDKIW